MDICDLVYNPEKDLPRFRSSREELHDLFGLGGQAMYHEGDELSQSVQTLSHRTFAAFSKKVTKRIDNPNSWKIERFALKLILTIGAVVANAGAIIEFAGSLGSVALLGVGLLLAKGVRKIYKSPATEKIHDVFSSSASTVGKHAGVSLSATILTTCQTGLLLSGPVVLAFIEGNVPDEPGTVMRSIDNYVENMD